MSGRPWVRQREAEEEWKAEAACRKVGPGDFYTDGDLGAAKAVCAGCPVREPCLAYAMANREHYGVWGGMGPGERDALRVAGGGLTRYCEGCGEERPSDEFMVGIKKIRMRRQCRSCRSARARQVAIETNERYREWRAS